MKITLLHTATLSSITACKKIVKEKQSHATSTAN